MAKKKVDIDYKSRAKKAWATKRRNQKERAKKSATRSEARKKAKKTPTIPYLRTPKLIFSNNRFTRSQVEELGLYGVTDDAENFRLLKINGQFVQRDKK